MNYTYESAEKSQIKLVMTLDKKDWDEAIKEAYDKTKGKYSVQGFRKGHVPFSVLCGVYGKQIFVEDALNISISKHYPEILKNEAEKINPVGDPDFSLGNFDEEKEIVLNALIPVMPEVKIESYKGIKVDKVEYNVTEDAIKADLDRLIERNAREIKITDRAAADKDIVVIDFSGSVDGVKFEGGTAEKYRLTLGSNSFVPGFEDQVVGMKIDEEKDVVVTFPEDYTDELKGKTAVFKVKLHEIIAKEYDELNDEFIKDATGDESVEAYKNKVREKMQKENDNRARNENEDKLLDAIAEKTTVEVPDCMIESEITNMISQFEYRLMYQGLKMEDYLKATNQTKESVREMYKEQAAARVKKQLIVNKIIENEKLTASQEEIDAKVDEQALSVSKTPEEYRKDMDQRQFEYISNSIVVDKLFNFLVENNDFVIAEKKETTKKTATKSTSTAKKTTAKKEDTENKD